MKTVFIRNLPFSARPADISAFFLTLGIDVDPKYVRVQYRREHPHVGESKGCAFVDLHEEYIDKALKANRVARMGGRPIFIAAALADI